MSRTSTSIHLGAPQATCSIAAIVDAWPELELGLANALRAAGIPETVQIHRIAGQRGGVIGSRFVIDAMHAPPAPTMHREFCSLLANSALRPDVCEQACSIITLLGEVAAEMHAVSIEEVEFHELGGWDTLVDCVAAAWLVNELGSPSWSVGPLPLGAPGSSLAAVEQHTRIFEAIRDADPDRAAEAARFHVDSVFAAYEQEVRRRVLEGTTST